MAFQESEQKKANEEQSSEREQQWTTAADQEQEEDIPSAAGGKPSPKNEAWEWIKALLLGLGIVIVVRHFVFATFIVDGPSMKPNFHTGERLIVNKLLYDFRDPKRGEVIVFHAIQEKDFIKRVIALPGETIQVQGDDVYINGELLDEPYIREAVEQAHKQGGSYNNFHLPQTKVPEGHVFVLGDNRPDSTDSRMIGPVQYDQIIGRADVIMWPIRDMQWIH